MDFISIYKENLWEYIASPFFNDKELDYYKKVLNILEKNLTAYAPLKMKSHEKIKQKNNGQN